MKWVSEIFDIKDAVTFTQNFVSFSSEVKFLTYIAHVKQLLAVLLQKQRWNVAVNCGNSDNNWPPDHAFGDENSPAEQHIADKNGVAKPFENNIIVILSTGSKQVNTSCKCRPSLFILGFCTSLHRNWRWTFWGKLVSKRWLQVRVRPILFGIRSLPSI